MVVRAGPVAPGRVVVRLLGPPRIERDGRPVAVDTRKAIALLAYLAITGRPASRDHLVALLWPDADQTRGRGALRRTLSSLNTALGGRGLRIERESLDLEPGDLDIDVHSFRALVARGSTDDLREAVAMHGGEFLAGFSLRDSVDFDEWQVSTLATLQDELVSALERLVRELTPVDVDAAIVYARRWVEVDPIAEQAHRALIGLHTQKGDRAAAVRQYRECVTLLERHLGVAPDEETVRLYEVAHRGPSRGTHAADASGLNELVGDLLVLQGRYGEAERSYDLARTLGSPAATIRGKIAAIRQRLGDYEGAEREYQAALASVGVSEHEQRAALLADLSLNAYRLGRIDDANDLAAQALAQAELAGDGPAVAQAHNIAGILAAHRGDVGQARVHLEASLAGAEALSDPVAMAAALNNLASALSTTQLERALELAQRALELCARVGDRHREAAMHSNLADLLRAAGRDAEAMSHLRLSAAIFAEIGEPDELYPEVWKLTKW